MDKIPPALQHKIDYINALDITARQKAVRTSTEIIDYWADYYKRRNLFIDTGSFESLGDLIFSENKGNNLGYNADSLGLALGSKPSRIIPPELSVSSVPVPPKRVINQDITLTNKGNVMGGGGGSGFCSEGGKGGSGFKASKADVDAQRIKDNDESMRRFYAMWSPL
jgi:hypothetical protein